LLGQGASDKDSLLLAAGQMPECRISMRVHSHVGEGIESNGLVLLCRSLEEA
jgi:hypothetical protein